MRLEAYIEKFLDKKLKVRAGSGNKLTRKATCLIDVSQVAHTSRVYG